MSTTRRSPARSRSRRCGARAVRGPRAARRPRRGPGDDQPGARRPVGGLHAGRPGHRRPHDRRRARLHVHRDRDDQRRRLPEPGPAGDQRRRRRGLRGHARRRHDGDSDQRRLHRAGHRRVRDHRPGHRAQQCRSPRLRRDPRRRPARRVPRVAHHGVDRRADRLRQRRVPQFGSPSLNNRGDLVFSADVIGGSGVLISTTGDRWSRWPTPTAIRSRPSRRGRPSTTPAWCCSRRSCAPRSSRCSRPTRPSRRWPTPRSSMRSSRCGLGSLNAAGRAAFIGLGTTGVQRVLTHDAFDQLADHRHHRVWGLRESVERRQFACAQRRGNGSLLGRSCRAGMSGIFTGPNPAASTVIQTGDALFGATVVEIELGGLNNRGEITFRAGCRMVGRSLGSRPRRGCEHGGC